MIVNEIRKVIPMDKKQLDFAVFCVENVAEHLNLTGAEVYALLAEKSNILDEYVIEYYDALHTQGKDYIVDDLVEYMDKEGVLMTANRMLLQHKYANVIAELSDTEQISLREAMDIFYKSYTYQEMRIGISDMHCRSDGYLAEEIMLENTDHKWLPKYANGKEQ